jgi:hypothetical protein
VKIARKSDGIRVLSQKRKKRFEKLKTRVLEKKKGEIEEKSSGEGRGEEGLGLGRKVTGLEEKNRDFEL